MNSPHVRPTARKIEWPPTEELRTRLLTETKSAVARSLGVNRVSLIRHLEREQKRIEAGVSSARFCRDCKEELTGDNSYTYVKKNGASYCKKCANIRKARSLRERKIQIVSHLGGKCVRCGYNNYYGALHVHHKNPEQKHKNFRHIRSWSWNRVLQEIENCELLCANCHAEEHKSDAGLV